MIFTKSMNRIAVLLEFRPFLVHIFREYGPSFTSKPGFCEVIFMKTVGDLALEFRASPDTIRKRIRSFLRFYRIPRERILVKRGNAWLYGLDDELYEKFKRFVQPKIHIEVKLQ